MKEYVRKNNVNYDTLFRSNTCTNCKIDGTDFDFCIQKVSHKKP